MKSLANIGARGAQDTHNPAPFNVPLPHTRESLIQLFGSAQMVDRLLDTMIREVNQDLTVLQRAQSSLDVTAVVEQLHRIVGCVAFLGATESETQGARLIAAVRQRGVVINQPLLEDFHKRMLAYLNDLKNL